MALLTGNRSFYNNTPSASTFTWTHIHNTGADGHMVITLAIPAGPTVTGVTYGGVSMTLIQRRTVASPAALDWTQWELDSPPTGSNSIVVTMNTANYNSCSAYVYSFTGCSGVANPTVNATPGAGSQTFTITASANSRIIATAYSSANTNAYVEIPQGTSKTVEWDHSVNNKVWGGISGALSAGSVTSKLGTSVTNDVVVMGVEVLEATSSTIPTVSTTAISNIGRLSADSGGNVTADGGASVTARGVCWNTTGTPTTSDSKTTNGTGTGSFTSNITSLSPNVTYYVRAYATNSVGTAYGDQRSFKTNRRIIIM